MRETPGGALRHWWEWLGLNLGKRAGTVAMVGLLVTLVFGVGVTKLRFSTSNSDYLNTNDPAWIDNVNYSKVFGGDPMAVLFTTKPGMTVDNLFTPANQREFKIVAAKLAKDPWVFNAVTPLDAMQFGSLLLKSPTGSPLNSPAGQLLSNAVKRDPSAASRKIRSAYLIKEGEILTTFLPVAAGAVQPQVGQLRRPRADRRGPGIPWARSCPTTPTR